MSIVPTQQVTVRMTGGPQGASIVGPAGPAGAAFAPVSAATDKNIVLSGIQNLDGVAGVANQRVLLTGQTTGSQNGLWLQQIGAWTRPGDFPAGGTPSGSVVYVVKGGEVFGRSIWTLETTGVTIDTTAQVWDINTVPNVEFSAHMVAQTFVPKNTNVTFPFDTVDQDTAVGWNAGTHTYTCPYSGYYFVSGQVRWAADIGGLTDVAINKNNFAAGAFCIGADHFGFGGSVARMIFCAAGDTLSFYVYQNVVGNAGNDTGEPQGTFLTISLMHQ